MKNHPREQSQHTSQIWDNYFSYAVQSDIFAFLESNFNKNRKQLVALFELPQDFHLPNL